MNETAQSSQRLFRPFTSGDWNQHSAMTDYRAEWFQFLAGSSGRPGQHKHLPSNCWIRSFARRASSGSASGCQTWIRWSKSISTPRAARSASTFQVCRPLQREDKAYHTSDLILAIWYNADKRVFVLREEEFDESVRGQLVNSDEAERAETRIRELTAAIFREEFPPPLVRNFAIAMEKSISSSQ